MFVCSFMVSLCLWMAQWPTANWKRITPAQLAKLLWRPWVISLVVGVLFPVFYGDGYNWLAALAVFVASWIFTSLAADMLHRARHASSLRVGLRKLSLSYHGMVVAHAGIAVTLIGVCLKIGRASCRG